VTSALGCLLVDVQHDFSETYLAAAGDADPAPSRLPFARLEGEALERLVHEGVTAADTVLQRFHRHDVPGPMALASRSPRRARSSPWPASSRRSIASTSANTIPPRRNAPVSLFRSTSKASRRAKAELAVHEATGIIPVPVANAPGLVRAAPASRRPV